MASLPDGPDPIDPVSIVEGSTFAIEKSKKRSGQESKKFYAVEILAR